MEGLMSFDDYKTIVDDSHSHTSVITDGVKGPGNAHHNYLIIKKEGNIPLNAVNFQNGGIKEAGINGVMNENLIAIVIDRLRGFQASGFACRQNAIALTKLEEALMWLKDRTNARVKEGIEGTQVMSSKPV